MSASKAITPAEAKSMGRWGVHRFSKCGAKYRGSGVYILKFNNGIKVGMAKNICSRLRAYQSPWIREIEQAVYYKTTSPQALEGFLKKSFQHTVHAENSTEFLSCVSFEYVTRFLEKNEFYDPRFNDVA